MPLVHQNHLILCVVLLLVMSCKQVPTSAVLHTTLPPTTTEQAAPIAEYIRNILQDKNGHLWFGTNGLGTAHYDGESISYYSIDQGFDGYQITGMTEDLDNNIWFSTDKGIVKYEWAQDVEGQKKFVNYSEVPLFQGQRFWSIFADSKGIVWAGGVREIYRFDGEQWAAFELPFPEKPTGDFITKGTSWCIIEDNKGNLWFSTNGYGAYKYDGKTFTQYSEKERLSDNSVDVILEDRQGHMWFGTRHGGVSRYDGESITPFPMLEGHSNDEVCTLYEDRSGNIWISSEGYGVYKYDGTTLTNYCSEQGLLVRAVQVVFEDKEGRLWVGGGGGLYKYEPELLPSRVERFMPVTKEGPWE